MKKILCFIGELNVDFQTELTQYFSDHIAEHDCEMTFMVNFDTLKDNFMYGEIEKKIISIPDLDRYDGVVICPDTYAITGMKDELASYLAEKAKCPVVSLRVHDDRFYSIVLGDYDAICQMTEHFILHHKMRRVCFMAGRMDLADAHVRLKAYRDTMAKYGLKVHEGMIFYGDYWRNKGDEAVDWFINQNEGLPQAIVCSNDYMALSVCNSLIKRGISVPDEVCVSGLDDISEVRYHIPPITSIRASISKICEKTIETFENIWSGDQTEKTVYLPLDMMYRNSCGCLKDFDKGIIHSLFLEKEKYLSALSFTPYLNLNFESADDIDELISAIRVKLTKGEYGSPDEFGVMYICLCDETERLNCTVEKTLIYTEKMLLKAIITPEKVEECNFTFERSEILPDQFKKLDSPLYVFTLHCRDYCYGYLVIQNREIADFKNIIKPLIFSIGGSFDRIRMFQALRDQSYVDELTRIPNRRSMERFIRRLRDDRRTSEHMLCIMSFDLDGLKYINDNFGHIEGDHAIKTAATILDRLKPDGGIAARTGGDEFVVMFISDEESDAINYIDKVNLAVEEINGEWDKPYKLSMSAGYEYCRSDMDMLLCMHKADNKMYRCKKAKKNRSKIPGRSMPVR